MIAAAKICGVNIFQENQTPKLITTHGLHLALFTDFFVNNLCIDKDEAVAPKEKRPSPLVITHPVVNYVHIPKLITEVNQVCVMIL